MALDKFQPYLFVSAGEQSNKFLTPTYADGIAQFQAQRAQELTGLTVRIDPIQEGSGDPSPTNIRPISGRTGMTVTVQSGETQNEYPVTWESIAGTVYGGTLDVVSGVLTATHKAVDLGTLDYTYDNDYKIFITKSITDAKTFIASALPTAVCSMFAPASWQSAATDATKDGAFCGLPKYNQWRFRDTNITDASAFKSNVNGQTFVYELANPQTYRLTGAEVRTIAGFNQIYSDAGPIIDIKF